MKKCLLLLLFFCALNYAQTTSNSTSAELAVMIEVSIMNIEGYHTSTDEIKTVNDVYPFSLYLSGRLMLFKRLNLEFRPGLVFAGDFGGYDFGFFVRYNFFKSLSVNSGINFHNNTGTSHGISIYEYIKGDFFTQLSIGVSANVSESFAFNLSYYHPLQKEYGYAQRADDNLGRIPIYQNYIIKFGVDFIIL